MIPSPGVSTTRICASLGGASGREPACRCWRLKRRMLNPWVRKIPWRRKWQPTPVFLPGEIPWTEEPGGLQSMGLHRVGHDRNNLAHSTCASMDCVPRDVLRALKLDFLLCTWASHFISLSSGSWSVKYRAFRG